MLLTTQIIKATCKGVKEKGVPNQDYIKISENNEHLIVSVSDGLGSSKYSLIGAEIACQVVIDNFKKLKSINKIEQLKTSIPQEWEEIINAKSPKLNDYRTTNSFVVVMKKENKIIIGRIGDAIIVLRIDELLLPISFIEKDFLNETDCLGSGGKSKYEITIYNYINNFQFLIATDGIGDELLPDKVESLLIYLSTKYKSIAVKKRNLILKKEINQNFNEKNNDDKSMVFVWSNKL